MAKTTYNMHEAKTNLSKLAERAAGGEEITIARNGEPVAKLVKAAPKSEIKLGLWADEEIWIADDFDDEDPEIIEMFYGEPISPKEYVPPPGKASDDRE